MKKASPFSHHYTSSSSSSSSTSTSIEAPRGCLRFFLSGSNPNSNTKPTQKNNNNKKKSTPCPPIYNCKSSSSSAKPKPKPLSSHPVVVAKSNDCNSNTPTPPTNLDNSSSGKNNTPPIQPSLSPEIQQQPLLHKQQPLIFEYGSSSTNTTTPCYAAGHVLSGVSDKRKCRPRGILSVADDDDSILNKGNVFDTTDTTTTAISNVLTVTTPREASVKWLLSPCKEEGEGGNNHAGFRRLEEGSLPLHFPSASPSSIGPGLSLDTTTTTTTTPTPTAVDACNTNIRRRSPPPSSPPGAGELLQFHFHGFLEPLFDNSDVLSPVPTTQITNHFAPKEGSPRCDSVDDPLSLGSSSGGGNVIRTPNSDSGSGRWVGLLPESPTTKFKKDQVGSELNPNVGAFDNKTISSESCFSAWDLTSSSFQLDGLDTPVDSIDLTLFQKVLDSEVSWVSNSTVDNNISESHLRISWRDGLASRILDMDEYDSCRCLSDDEGDAVVCSPKLEPCQSPQHNAEMRNGRAFNRASDLMQLLESKIQLDQPGKENCPPNVPSLSVESMSMDGNSMTASVDSDWNLCYKNKLFEV